MKTKSASRMESSFWTMNDEMNPANKVSFVREIDATQLDLFRAKAGSPSYTALVAKAASQVLKEFPYANRTILQGIFGKYIVAFETTDIAIAVEKAVPNAEAVVYAHIIRDVENKDCLELHQDLARVADPELSKTMPRWVNFLKIMQGLPTFLARHLIGAPRYSAKLWQEHRGGACFVNSPAKYGVDFLVADMIWPLTFSFGWIKERPWAVGKKVEVRRTMPLIMIFDRRIMQGALAAKAFNRFAEILEKAEFESLLSSTYDECMAGSSATTQEPQNH